MEYTVDFRSLAGWKSWLDKHPEMLSPTYIEQLVNHVRTNGASSPFFSNWCAPHMVVISNDIYRESLLCYGLCPRLRAILDLLAAWPPAQDTPRCRIYAPEALTPFALLLRGRYPRFIGSEYTDDFLQRQELFPIPCEDILRLSFPDSSFDCVLCCEIFEHIPELRRGLRELARITQAGGLLLATFPFHYLAEQTEIKAKVTGNGIQCLSSPEYHGNPMDPARGSLVFQIPGWDILSTCTDAGFADAKMTFVSSPDRAITGSEIAGVFVLQCTR